MEMEMEMDFEKLSKIVEFSSHTNCGSGAHGMMVRPGHLNPRIFMGRGARS